MSQTLNSILAAIKDSTMIIPYIALTMISGLYPSFLGITIPLGAWLLFSAIPLITKSISKKIRTNSNLQIGPKQPRNGHQVKWLNKLIEIFWKKSFAKLVYTELKSYVNDKLSYVQFETINIGKSHPKITEVNVNTKKVSTIDLSIGFELNWQPEITVYWMHSLMKAGMKKLQLCGVIRIQIDLGRFKEEKTLMLSLSEINCIDYQFTYFAAILNILKPFMKNILDKMLSHSITFQRGVEVPGDFLNSDLVHELKTIANVEILLLEVQSSEKIRPKVQLQITGQSVTYNSTIGLKGNNWQFHDVIPIPVKNHQTDKIIIKLVDYDCECESDDNYQCFSYLGFCRNCCQSHKSKEVGFACIDIKDLKTEPFALKLDPATVGKFELHLQAKF